MKKFINLNRIPILLFFIVFISASYFSTFSVDPHHDGLMLKSALDVSRGQILYKDTFNSMEV